MKNAPGFILITVLALAFSSNVDADGRHYHLSKDGLCNKSNVLLQVYYEMGQDVEITSGARATSDHPINIGVGECTQLGVVVNGDDNFFRANFGYAENRCREATNFMSCQFSLSADNHGIHTTGCSGGCWDLGENKVDNQLKTQTHHGSEHFQITASGNVDTSGQHHTGLICVNDFVAAKKPYKEVLCSTMKDVEACGCPACSASNAKDCNCKNCAVAK